MLTIVMRNSNSIESKKICNLPTTKKRATVQIRLELRILVPHFISNDNPEFQWHSTLADNPISAVICVRIVKKSSSESTWNIYTTFSRAIPFHPLRRWTVSVDRFQSAAALLWAYRWHLEHQGATEKARDRSK